MENLNIDQSTPSQRFSALEIQIKNRTRILELIRKWHLGANDPTIPPASSSSSSNKSSAVEEKHHQAELPPLKFTTSSGIVLSIDSCPGSPPPPPPKIQESCFSNTMNHHSINKSQTFAPPSPPPFCRLSSLFFGCMYVSRNQLCEWFESSDERILLTQKMFHYGMGVGALLSDAALSASSPASDFLFHLFEMHLEIQLDATATNQLPPARLLNQRSLRKDREERLGETAAATLRPAPRHLEKETGSLSRPARFAADSFLFHEANRSDVKLPLRSMDYFAVCLGFVQTMLLCYRRLLDSELVKNTMALKRFVQFDEQLEENVMKPLFKELRALVDYLLTHAENEMMTALAAI